MEPAIATNKISQSLLSRNVYCVCFPLRDSLDLLRGEFFAARKKFFTNGKRTVRVGQKEIVKGFEGKLQGKLGRHVLYWKKVANKIALEEAFDQKGGAMLVFRDFRGIITSRVFFDKNQVWLKSEYYEPWDNHNARVIFKPCDGFDGVERFDYDKEKKRYRSTLLYPSSYLPGTAEQSLINARFGEAQLVLSTEEGDFCYCPKKEAEERAAASEELQNGSILLTPAWEVKEGSIVQGKDTGETLELSPLAPEEVSVSFPSLGEYAKITASTEPAEAGLKENTETKEPRKQEEKEPEKKKGKEQEKEKKREEPHRKETTVFSLKRTSEPPLTDPDTNTILEAARRLTTSLSQPGKTEPPPQACPAPPESPAEEVLTILERMEGQSPPQAAPAEESASPSADVQELFEMLPQAGDEPFDFPELPEEELPGDFRENIPLSHTAGLQATPPQEKLSGRGRAEQPNGFTTYDGEYRDGTRHGFGSYYYEDGVLCYAGFWKDGQKDGMGVSFRNSDHALHISRWEQGKPQGFAALFDKDGTLRYGGRIENGKKQGAGVTYCQEDGTLFVGKWENGQPTGYGSSFDQDGNLLYSGMWKNGRRDGNGTEFAPNGEIIFSGEWKNGKYHNGILYKKTGHIK